MQVPTDSSVYFQVPSRNVARPAPGERPPQYAIDSERNLIYSFVPAGISSMTVIPRNLEMEVPEAKYYVSIRMNCFMPSSYITTIHLGTNEQGQKLGMFEMGMVAAASCVRIGGVTNNTAIALTQSGIWGYWYWHPARIHDKYHLRWEFDKRPCICRAAYGSKNILARFTPAESLGDALPELEVMPNGREVMDHILLSLLIVERKRLTPGRPETTREIFN